MHNVTHTIGADVAANKNSYSSTPAFSLFMIALLVDYLEEKLCAFLHDLLDLEEASGVHEQELVSNVHAEASRVAEGQDLLEALRLHGRGQLHH